MPQIIRGSAVLWNGKKIAEVQKSNYQLNGNVTPEVGSEGFLGNSLGPIMSKLKLDCIVPVTGLTTRLNVQQSGNLGVYADGKLHTIEATVDSATYDSDNATGKNTVAFEFSGGTPRIS